MSGTNEAGFLNSLMHIGVWGTFLRAPLIPLNRNAIQEIKGTVAFLGAPWEGCESYRPGSSFGPQCIRQVTSQFSSYNCELDLDINDHIKLIDVGDIPVVPGNRDESLSRIERGVREIIAAGAIPIVIGGDHSVTLPVFTGFVKEKNPKRVGLIQFDNHLDTADTASGERISDCTQILRIAEMDCVNPSNIVQIGIRGWLNPKEEVENSKRLGMHVFNMSDCEKIGWNNVIERAIEIATDGTDALYVTVDIDVLDPAYAPGTSATEPGGPTSKQLFDALRRIGEFGVSAFDLCCVAPQYDINGITQLAAVRCILEFIAGTVIFRDRLS